MALLLLGLIAEKAHGQTPGLDTRIVGKGQPVLLIPGLTCPGEVWDETMEEMGDGYEFHVVTLPGFAGNAPLASHDGKYLEKMKDLLLNYVQQHQLEKPIIMGHSLGGFLALNIAIDSPDLPSKLVIVDSLPFLPGIQMPGSTLESVKPMAESMRTQMIAAKDQPAANRASFQRVMLKSMILDSAKIERAVQWSVDSDMETVAQAMYELYTSDIRADLAKIKVPTLVLGAYIAYKPYGATRESTLSSYTGQYAQLKDVVVDLTDKGNHFIMWDDPEFFHQWLNKFL